MQLRQLYVPLSGEEKLPLGPGRILALAVSIVLPLVLYTICASHSESGWDASERALAMMHLGLGHPSGSPLHALFGKAFLVVATYVQPVSTAFAVNLFSALCGALASGMLFLTLINFTRRAWLALLVSLAIATSAVPWTQSIYSEVYALHYFLLALFLFLWVRWLIVGHPRTLLAASFIYALSLGVHMSSALLAPGILVCLLMTRPRTLLRPRQVLLALLFLLIGLSWLLYVYIRGQSAQILGAAFRPDSLQAMFQYLYGAQFHEINFLIAPTLSDQLTLLAKRSGLGLMLIVYSTLGVGFGFALLGIGSGLYRAPGLTVMGVLTILIFFIYFGIQATMDFATLILPLWLFLGIFMLFGFEGWTENKIRSGELIDKAYHQPSRTLLLLIVAQLVVFPAASLSHYYLAPVKDEYQPTQKSLGGALMNYVWKGIGKTLVYYKTDPLLEEKLDSIETTIQQYSDRKRILMATWDIQTLLTYEQQVTGRFRNTWILEWHHQRRFYNYDDGLVVESHRDIVERFIDQRDIFTLSWEKPDPARFGGHDVISLGSYDFDKQKYYLYKFVPDTAPAETRKEAPEDSASPPAMDASHAGSS